MSWIAQYLRWIADDVSRRVSELDRNRKIALATAIVLLVFLLWWRGPRPGDIYCVDGENDYRMAKVLVVDSDAVHIRLYKNSFHERPSRIDPSILSLGSIHDPEGFGVGHVPLSRSTFSRWHPHYLTHASVTGEELEEYKQWKESKGGIF